MSTRPHLPALLLGVVLLAAPVLAGPEDWTQIEVPVSGWTASVAGPDVYGPPRLLPGYEIVADEPGAPGLFPEQMASDLLDLFAEEVAIGGGEIEVVPAGLRLAGPEALVTRVRSRIEAVSRFVEGRSMVTVALFEVAPREDGSEGEVRRLLLSARFSARRGETAVRESVERTNLVIGHGTDVAQYASVMDPETAVVETGTRVAVQTRPLGGDLAEVVLSLHVSRMGEGSRRVRTSSGDLDLPEVPFAAATAAFRATRGEPETLVVPSPFGAGKIVAVVQVRRLPGDPPVPVVDLVPAAGRPDLRRGWRPPAGSRSTTVYYEDETSPPYWTEGTKHGLRGLRDRLEHDAEGIEVRPLGPTVFALVGGDEAVARARSLIDARPVRRLGRTLDRLAWDEAVRAGWFDPLTGEAAGRPTGGFDLEAPVGSTPFLMLGGTWRRVIAGLSANVSTGAGLVAPVAVDRFDGEALFAESAGTELDIRYAASEILGIETAPSEVRLDIEGVRVSQADHLVDRIRSASAEARLSVGPHPHAEILRLGPWALRFGFTVQQR